MSSTRTAAARLYHQLWLEVKHMEEAMSYDAATSFCSDCPHKNWDDWTPQSYSDMEFGPRIADHCCKDEDDYMQSEREHIRVCEQIMALLKTFAGDEELAAAQATIAQGAKNER